MARLPVERIGSRLAMALCVWLLAGVLAATLVRLSPGFATDERLMDARLSESSREAVENSLGGGVGLVRFYLDYLGALLRGDLGTSVILHRPVRDLLAERLAISFRTAAAGLAIAWVFSLLATAALELMRNPVWEHLLSLAAGSLLCLPAALVALLAVYGSAPPSAAVAIILAPRIFRYVRNLARQATSAPHVLAARALGLRRRRVLLWHVAVPVLPEALALAGISVSLGIGTLIPVEALTGSPGVGHLVWDAAQARDLPVLVNVTLLIAAITITANLAASALTGSRSEAA
jgi:peptide/nickel transport system permease protein